MTDLVRIPVPGGLIAHGKTIHEVVLQAPNFDTYLELGDIVTFAKAPDGTVFSVENAEVLRSYLARCLVEPKDPLILGQGGLKLAKAVKGAVLGFFLDAPSAGASSETSQTISSSNASPDGSAPTP